MIEPYSNVFCADSMLTSTLTYSRMERALQVQNILSLPEDDDADPNEAIARSCLEPWRTR